ncbi:hypothetical protein BD309DRAFT_853870 [Dichomitus squalens]|uniref:Uncharacterized protein n=1 Tax=Dichomitus squalens TaxID=114155 RepID=A0A4Q9PW91_9APHY|nr:uncharacterized protein DICSQDRAFT_103366 [Dichomitus squalens LYAD-421 SS1]EJF62959.1 hypothetical protein DICSQDRAFT_103366 [Dichomitus squalens LYAD-421 SS1]TBU48483.1 hypothetical protein BD309DRAFT_853870 [Dichomitus squalens]TBU58756.1 hypothetical protein BD310DRAFT_948485 [Dichomitus squalens]
MVEYFAMCDLFAWPRHGNCDERDLARGRLKDAMVQQFNSTYGRDVNDVVAWQNLCKALEVDPVPDNMQDCQKVIESVHVNICDLVEAPILGPPRDFGSEEALAIYSKSTGKIFPRNNVHAGSLLRYLLRHILSHPGIGYRRA